MVLVIFWFCIQLEPALGDSTKNDLFTNAIKSKGLIYGEFRKLILDDAEYEVFLASKLNSDVFPHKEIAAAMLEWGKSKNEILRIQSEVYVDIIRASAYHAGWIYGYYSVSAAVPSDDMVMLLGGGPLPKKKLSKVSETYMIELAIKGLTVTEYDKKYLLTISERDGSELKYLGIQPYDENKFKWYLEKYRGYAIAVLGSYEVINAVPVLKELLSDKSESRELHECAARSLGMMRDMSSVEVLVDSLNDKNLDVQKHVIRSLIQLTGKDFYGDVGKYQEWVLHNPDHFEKVSRKSDD